MGPGVGGSPARAAFAARAGWNYILERSTDLEIWEPVAAQAGEGAMQLTDQNPPPAIAFYRVRADRL